MRRYALHSLCALLWLSVSAHGFAGRVLVHLSLKPGGHVFLDYDPEARVLFFPQAHYSDELDPAGKLSVLRSQFSLARFLCENPHYEVFLEGSHDYGPADREAAVGKDFHASFAGGAFPTVLTDLDRTQKTRLFRMGAPMILYGMKILPEVHAAIPPGEGRKLDEAIEAHLQRTGQTFETMDHAGMDLVTRQRDAAAAKQVKAYLASHPDKKVLLVFGAAHDFRPFFEGVAYAQVEEEAAPPAEESKEPARGAGAGAPLPASSAIVDALQSNHRTRLMNAAADGKPRLVEEMLGYHADPRIRDRMGYNALILAGLGRHMEVLEVLLKHLAPADVRMPVTLSEGDMVKTHEDVIALLEERNEERGADFHEVIMRLKAFAGSSPAPGRGPANPPGFTGDLSRFLPPWL